MTEARITALYCDPQRVRTYSKNDWVVVVSYGCICERVRFHTEEAARAFATKYGYDR